MQVHILAGIAVCLLAHAGNAADEITQYFKIRNGIHSQCAQANPTNSSIYTGGCGNDILYFHYDPSARMFSTYDGLCLSAQAEEDIVLWNADGEARTDLDLPALYKRFGRRLAGDESPPEDSTELSEQPASAAEDRAEADFVPGQESQLMLVACDTADAKQKFGVSEGIYGQLVSDYYNLCADVEHQHYNARVILWTCKDMYNYKAPNQQWYSYGHDRDATELEAIYNS